MNYSETLPFSTWKSFPVLRFKELNQVCLSWRVEVYGSLSYLGTRSFLLFQRSGPLCLANIALDACAQSWLDRLGIPLGNQPRGWAVPFWFSLLESWVSELRIGRSCRPEGSDCVMRSWWVWPKWRADQGRWARGEEDEANRQEEKDTRIHVAWKRREDVCPSFWLWSFLEPDVLLVSG